MKWEMGVHPGYEINSEWLKTTNIKGEVFILLKREKKKCKDELYVAEANLCPNNS